jgi:hypothetical protein
MTRDRNKRMSLAQKFTRFIDEHQTAELEIVFKSTRHTSRGDIEKLIKNNISVASERVVGKSRVRTVEIKKGMKLNKLELFTGSYTISFSDNSKHNGLFAGYGKFIKDSFKLLTLIVG